MKLNENNLLLSIQELIDKQDNTVTIDQEKYDLLYSATTRYLVLSYLFGRNIIATINDEGKLQTMVPINDTIIKEIDLYIDEYSDKIISDGLINAVKFQY